MKSQTQSLPTAADVMKRTLVTFTPEMSITEAIRQLIKYRISGAPVVDAQGRLVGICSELDCLRVLTAGEFYRDDHREEGVVGDFMTTCFATVDPKRDLYSIAQHFLTHAVRRLPVVDGDQLVGQISRRDVLVAMDAFSRKRIVVRQYPDYREPAADVGARRAP